MKYLKQMSDSIENIKKQGEILARQVEQMGEEIWYNNAIWILSNFNKLRT
jgi:hypothetical protein